VRPHARMDLLLQQWRKSYNGRIKYVKFSSRSSHWMVLVISPRLSPNSYIKLTKSTHETHKVSITEKNKHKICHSSSVCATQFHAIQYKVVLTIAKPWVHFTCACQV
jgi:hypothetical protein